MTMQLAQVHKYKFDPRAIWHQSPSFLHDVVLPPQRVLVKDESPFPSLEILLHGLPSTEPSIHCVCMFELKKTSGENWYLSGAKLEPAAYLGSSGFSREIYPSCLLLSPLKGKGAKVRRAPSPQHTDLALADLNHRLPGGALSSTPTNHLNPRLQSLMMLSPTSE